MKTSEEKRKFLRVKVKRLTGIVKHEGQYKLVETSTKQYSILIDLENISTGGMRITSTKEEFKKSTLISLVIPKTKTLDHKTVKCEVTRAHLEDDNYIHDVGLRFITPNTEYLKQLVEAFKTY